MATTLTSPATLVLIAVSVASSIRAAALMKEPAYLRAAHAVMASAMAIMAVGHTTVAHAMSLVLLVWAARRVAASLHRSVTAVPCLFDTIGMLLITALTLLGTLTGDQRSRVASHAPMLTVLTLTTAMLWAVGAVWLRSSSSKLAARTTMAPTAHAPVGQVNDISSMTLCPSRWAGLPTALLTTAAMTAMAPLVR